MYKITKSLFGQGKKLSNQHRGVNLHPTAVEFFSPVARRKFLITGHPAGVFRKTSQVWGGGSEIPPLGAKWLHMYEF